MSSSYITRQAVPKIAWGASGIPLFLCQLICNVKALAALVVLCVARYVEPVRSLLFFFFLLLFFFCCHNFRAHRGIGLKHPSIHFGCPASRPAKSFFQTTYTSTHQRRLPRIKILRLSHHDRSHPWNLNLFNSPAPPLPCPIVSGRHRQSLASTSKASKLVLVLPSARYAPRKLPVHFA